MPFNDPEGYQPRAARDAGRAKAKYRASSVSDKAKYQSKAKANYKPPPQARKLSGTNPFGSPTFQHGKSVPAASRVHAGGQSGTPEDSKPGTTYRPRHARGARGQLRPT